MLNWTTSDAGGSTPTLSVPCMLAVIEAVLLDAADVL
jgi:hypothetical protein